MKVLGIFALISFSLFFFAATFAAETETPLRVVPQLSDALLKHGSFKDSWRPEQLQVDEIFGELFDYLKMQSSFGRLKQPVDKSYHFQLLGFKKNGVPFIRIQAFCVGFEDAQRLKTSWVEVADGGSCFFQLNYDPSKKEFYDLYINGTA